MKQIYKISDFFPENPGVSFNDWLGIMKVNLKYDTKPTRIERLISKLSDIEDSDELELAKKDILQIIYSNIDGGRDMYCSGMELKGKEGYENAADVIAEFEKKLYRIGESKKTTIKQQHAYLYIIKSYILCVKKNFNKENNFLIYQNIYKINHFHITLLII